ncbi:MAG TPA: DUF2922 domain-containing protein [Caldisericia bacterium]|jgi:hypothetical protein|nr:DUF2922 domain-containing protein [Caldisericia bacterium]
MADSTVNYVRMTFKNTSGNNYSIQLRYPKEDLTTTEVENVMNTIITKNIISTKGGNLNTVADGGVLIRSFTDLIE